MMPVPAPLIAITAVWLLCFTPLRCLAQAPGGGGARPVEAKSDKGKDANAVKQPDAKQPPAPVAPTKPAAAGDGKAGLMDLLKMAADSVRGVDIKGKSPALKSVAVEPEPKRVPAPPVAAAPARPAVNVEESLRLQFEQRYAARFRQLLKSELHFMRTICDPTRPQFEKIAKDCEPGLKKVVHDSCKLWMETQQRRFRPSTTPPEIRKLIVDEIVKIVGGQLSVEQTERYRKEIEARDATRKRVTLLNLVSAIDHKLLLTREQREQLVEILENNWKPAWAQPQLIAQGFDYLPLLPDARIVQILTETQKTRWRTLPKGNAYFAFELDYFRAMEIDDEVWPAETKK